MINIIPFASGSGGNLYLLKQNDNNYLIECGVKEKEIRGYLFGCGNLMISDIQACFISHAHT